MSATSANPSTPNTTNTANTTSAPTNTSTPATDGTTLSEPQQCFSDLDIGLAAGIPGFVAVALLVALIVFVIMVKKQRKDPPNIEQPNQAETSDYYNVSVDSHYMSLNQRPLPRIPAKQENVYHSNLPNVYNNHAVVNK
ncbi:opalin [Amia ocellicauda]|uniref:opalin n=1 Tax=Amia ocellicauda TaxID=2972642 RepID=UPI00346476EA